MTDEQTSTAYTGWAVVELMGHRRIAGYVSEATQFGAAMIRIDVPADAEDGQPVTQFYGGSSIYCLTPVSEESARAVARYHRPAPVHQYELVPPVKAVPEPRFWCPRCDDRRVVTDGQLCDPCQDAVDDENPRDDFADDEDLEGLPL